MKKTGLILTLIVLLVAGNALASGFRVPEQGSVAMGMANAWVAQADGPEAIFMNPAGIAQLEGPAVELGTVFIVPTIEHKDAAGDTTETESSLFVTPSVFGTCNMGTGNWAFGIGVSTPFGLGTEWAEDSFARYSSTLTNIELVNINPSLAYKVSDSLFFGVGLDYYRSNVTIERMVPWGMISYGATGDPSMLAVPDGKFNLEGDGGGWGYNAGLLYKFGERYTLGLAYRSGITVEYDGVAELTDIGGAGLMQYGASSFKTDGTAELNYPALAQLGLAAQVTEALLVEFDVEWADWSAYDELKIKFDSPLVADTTSEKNWSDTYTFRLGANYAASDALDLRFGYLYDDSPVDEAHYDTLLPDGEKRHGFTLGFGYRLGKVNIDASYLGLFVTERTIDVSNPEYPLSDLTGTYKGYNSLLALNVSYFF